MSLHITPVNKSVNKKRCAYVHPVPEILGGTPVFSGTRVPIRILIEYLEAGDRLDDFLESYPTVSRTQAIEALERAKTALTRTCNKPVV